MPIASNKRSARLGFDYFWYVAGDSPVLHYFVTRLQNYVWAHGFMLGYFFIDERPDEFRVTARITSHKRFLKLFGFGKGSSRYFTISSGVSNRYKKYITRRARKAKSFFIQEAARLLVFMVVKYLVYVYIQYFTEKLITLEMVLYDSVARRYPYAAWTHRYLFYAITKREQMEAYVNSLAFSVYFEDYELSKNVINHQWPLKKKNIVFLKQTAKYVEQLAPLNVKINGFSITARGKMNGALRASKKVVKFGEPIAEELFAQSLVELSAVAQTYTGTFGIKMHFLLDGVQDIPEEVSEI